MTRLSVERLEEIRSGADAGQCPYVGRCNSSRCPKHGGAARAVRDLLAELDAVRADLAHCERSYVAARTAHANAETERDDLQARLLVMTQERDEHAAHVATMVQQDKGRLESIEALMDRAEAAEAQLAAEVTNNGIVQAMLRRERTEAEEVGEAIKAQREELAAACAPGALPGSAPPRERPFDLMSRMLSAWVPAKR
jgi:septal ring factor EnvC (AmiA/AmiB activator)